MTRAPLATKGIYNNDYKPKNTLKEADICPSGLNSESGATRSVSDTMSIQATTHLMSRTASDLQCGQSKSASSKPVQTTQVLTDTRSHSSSSSVSFNFAPPQTTRSKTAQNVVAQVGQHLPQSISLQTSQSQQVFRTLSDPLQSTSLLQSSSSVPGKTVLKIIPSNLPQHGMVIPQVVLPQSQSCVLAAAVPSNSTSCPSVAHSPVSVNTASVQSFYLNSLINTQSHTNQTDPSFPTIAPFAQSNQAMSNPSTLKSSSSHTHQTISQAVSGQSSKIAPTNVLRPCSQAVSNTQSVNQQSSSSTRTKSNHVQLTLLNIPNNISSLSSGTAWTFYQYIPTASNSNTLTCVPQSTNHIFVRDKESTNPTYNKVSHPQAHRLLPARSDKVLDPPVSNKPQFPAAPIPSVHGNAGQIECATQTTQMATCELPVKAPADSVCEGDMSVCSRASPVAEEADSTLPSSTVPEENTKAKELPAVHQPQDPLSTTSVKDCPPNQSFLTQSESSLKNISTLSSAGTPSIKHWLTSLPSSFREILCSHIKVSAEDTCSRSALELTSLPKAKVINIMTLSSFFYDSL